MRKSLFFSGHKDYLLGLILFSLSGLASCLALGVGPHKAFVGLTQVLIVLQIVYQYYDGRRISSVVGFLLIVPFVFWFCDKITPNGISDKYSVRNLVAFFAIAVAVSMLPKCWHVKWYLRPLAIALTIASVTTCVHLVSIYCFNRSFGLFDNPHFLSLQALVVLPVAIYFFFRSPGRVRWFGLALLSGVLVILLSLPTKAGWSALLIAAPIILWFFLPPRKISLIILVLLTLAVFVALIHVNFDHTQKAEIADILIGSRISVQDERSIIWVDAWRMQKDSNAVQWLFGHGLGGFEYHFAEYTRLSDDLIFHFPHNFVLEILFNSGGLGLASFLACISALLVTLARQVKERRKPIALLALTLLVVVGIFMFLTLPILSRYSAYVMGFVIGFSLWVINTDKNNEY